MRIEDKRIVKIQEGDPAGLHVLIVDDLVRSGGTLFESAKVLKDAGATAVSVFVAHAAFPQSAWKRFARGGDRDIFERFWTTNRYVVCGGAWCVVRGAWYVVRGAWCVLCVVC